jgi:hypothetical protein
MPYEARVASALPMMHDSRYVLDIDLQEDDGYGQSSCFNFQLLTNVSARGSSLGIWGMPHPR